MGGGFFRPVPGAGLQENEYVDLGPGLSGWFRIIVTL
jgi:hypothetical protein